MENRIVKYLSLAKIMFFNIGPLWKEVIVGLEVDKITFKPNLTLF